LAITTREVMAYCPHKCVENIKRATVVDLDQRSLISTLSNPEHLPLRCEKH
jgi:hypothetical protein